MKQQDIYKKDINRPINGVIKADSIQELKVEITEFVITAEQQQDQKLPKFFHTLVPPTLGFKRISAMSFSPRNLAKSIGQ